MHGEIRAHIQQAYRELNGIACPWDGSEASCLTKMLKANPSWGVDDWLRMVSNHFLSEGVNGDRPRIWLPNISRYSRGPLDKFGRINSAPEFKPFHADNRKLESECLCYTESKTGRKVTCPHCSELWGE